MVKIAVALLMIHICMDSIFYPIYLPSALEKKPHSLVIALQIRILCPQIGQLLLLLQSGATQLLAVGPHLAQLAVRLLQHRLHAHQFVAYRIGILLGPVQLCRACRVAAVHERQSLTQSRDLFALRSYLRTES